MTMELYHDDCFNVFPMIKDKSIDLVLCDMPYGTTACKWDTIIDLERMWIGLKRICKNNSAVALFGTEPFSSILRLSNLSNYKYDWIWDKVTARGHLVAKIRPLQQTENICIFQNKHKINYYPQMIIRPENKIERRKTREYARTEIIGGNKKILPPKIYDKWYPKNIITISNANSSNESLHPTQKPLFLMEYLIKTYSNEGDTVLDFCMGSGTTGVACKNLNRNFIGIEKEKEYYDIAVKRINETMIDKLEKEEKK